MKKVSILVLAVSSFMISCNTSSNIEAKDAKENLTNVKSELKEAVTNENEVAKAKERTGWNSFKNDADSSVARIENDLKKLEVRIEKSGKSDKQRLMNDFDKLKSDMEALKERLQKRNIEFDSDIENYDNNVYEKNQSFKREYKHDMEGLGKSIKDIFVDNVK